MQFPLKKVYLFYELYEKKNEKKMIFSLKKCFFL